MVEGREIRERQQSVNKWLKRRSGEGKVYLYYVGSPDTKDWVRPCFQAQSSRTRRKGTWAAFIYKTGPLQVQYKSLILLHSVTVTTQWTHEAVFVAVCSYIILNCRKTKDSSIFSKFFETCSHFLHAAILYRGFTSDDYCPFQIVQTQSNHFSLKYFMHHWVLHET